MDIENIVKICSHDANRPNLAIDELHDYINRIKLDSRDLETIVDRLAEHLKLTQDPAVWESIFNLFGSISTDEAANGKIADITARHLFNMTSSCLAHAIPIIAASNLSDKTLLLSSFFECNNSAVKILAFKYLNSTSDQA